MIGIKLLYPPPGLLSPVLPGPLLHNTSFVPLIIILFICDKYDTIIAGYLFKFTILLLEMIVIDLASLPFPEN